MEIKNTQFPAGFRLNVWWVFMSDKDKTKFYVQFFRPE